MAIYSIPVKDGQTGEIIYVRIEAKNNQEAKQIARNTEGYCGADIEEIVEHEVEPKNVEGKGEDIKIEDLERIIKNMDSLKSILNEQIEKLNVYKQNEKSTIKNTKKSALASLIDMVVVNRGEYEPVFRQYEVKVIDLEVSKYPVTNKLWDKIMRGGSKYFATVDLWDRLNIIIKNPMLPVEEITYWGALEFCNRLSKKYGLKPVYKINHNKQSIKIIELDGKEVDPGKADFSKTEGFRLPTEVEWEWFARGGEVAIQNNTFDYKYSESNNIDDVTVYRENTDQDKNVGTKKPNQLGLYDCSGNVWEWCYDTWLEGNVYIKNEFIYDESVKHHVLRRWSLDEDIRCGWSRGLIDVEGINYSVRPRFRVVRTKKKISELFD